MPQLTLHAAIAAVLVEHKATTLTGHTLTTAELQSEIVRLALYQHQDGTAASTEQVSARVGAHAELFEFGGRPCAVSLRVSGPCKPS